MAEALLYTSVHPPFPAPPMTRSLLFTGVLLIAAFSLAAYTLHRDQQLLHMEAEAHGI